MNNNNSISALGSDYSVPSTSFAKIDEGTEKAAEKAHQIFGEERDKSAPTSPTTQALKHNPFFYLFPENTKIKLNSGQSIDISNIGFNLSGIFRGGIGWGGSASKLLSRAMPAIGNSRPVFNLPFCVEGSPSLPAPYNKLTTVSTEDKDVSPSIVCDMIRQSVQDGFTFINIPLNVNGHASLASFVISNLGAEIRFYESMSSQDLFYDLRYNQPLIDFLKSYLPESIKLKTDQPKVLHLLYQGDKESYGCGYYTAYIALLLKEREELRDLESYDGPPLLDNSHDIQIRAELVVRTLLDYGLEKVDLRFESLINEPRDGIFSRIDFELIKLVEALKPSLSY